VILDEAADGLHVITAMLVVGLIFLAVVALGELTHRANHRRKVRKPKPRPY
jgi:hypothetical protein